MTRRSQYLGTPIATGMAVALAAAGVWAAIVSTSGQMTEIAPPASVQLHQLESDTTQFAFEERECVTLPSAVRVNITAAGTYDDSTDIPAATIIPAGTQISSYFVHADKVGTGPPRIELEGTLTVDAKILGVIVKQGALDNSDFLGPLTTSYPTGVSGRAMNFDTQNDFIILDASLTSVTIHTDNQFHADQVRVITECGGGGGGPQEPPPGTNGCTPGFWKQSQHLDSWEGYLPTDSFNTVFGLSGPFSNSLTLLGALNLTGGGPNALARHAVSALLNAASDPVNYPLTVAQVIAETQAAFASGDAVVIETQKARFAVFNQNNCPLD